MLLLVPRFSLFPLFPLRLLRVPLVMLAGLPLVLAVTLLLLLRLRLLPLSRLGVLVGRLVWGRGHRANADSAERLIPNKVQLSDERINESGGRVDIRPLLIYISGSFLPLLRGRLPCHRDRLKG